MRRPAGAPARATHGCVVALFASSRDARMQQVGEVRRATYTQLVGAGSPARRSCIQVTMSWNDGSITPLWLAG